MEDGQDFLTQLDNCLRAKRNQLEETTIQTLRDELRQFGSNFYTIYNYLVQKGLLKEDLYNYDQKSKMEPPSAEPIGDGELIPELSFRMASYQSVLEYLNNMFQIDIDRLSLNGIKEILNIVNYIKWESLGGNTAHPVTRALSTVYDKIISSTNDPMSSEIRFNSITTMTRLCKNIKIRLKQISLYLREVYKFKIRSLILAENTVTSEMVNRDKKGLLLNIKMEMNSLLPDEPFYRELIEEILDEDFGYEGDKKRAELLDRMKVAEKEKSQRKEKKKQEIVVGKKDLLKIVPHLASAADQLSAALAKLDHNREITSKRRKSLGEILRRFFARKETDIIYEVRTLDPVTGQNRRERISFNSFGETIRKKIVLLRNIGNANSAQYMKLSQYQEEMLYSFLDNNLIELRSIHKRVVGLDGLFKKEEDQTIRARIRGVKVEADTIKRIYMECSKDLKEYKARKQELAQLQALGIE